MSKYYEVVEDNGGGLTLFVYNENKEVIYAHTGYEYLLPSADLRIDIAAIENGDDPTSWDGCWGDNSDEAGTPVDFRASFDDESKCNGGWRLIADSYGVYYDRMGSAGKSVFGCNGEAETFDMDNVKEAL